jgi:Xaa-Pro aminopeptidase
MSRFGTMAVDWEERINFDRMRRERLSKAQKALKESGADVLFVFRSEDARYLTGFRSHLHPTAMLGNATVVLPKDGDPILFSMDYEHCKARMPWMKEGTNQPRSNFREKAGLTKWTNQIKSLIGELDGKVIGVDLWTPTLAEGLKELFPKSEFVDGYDILMKAKIIKTQDEIECLQMANVITEAGMQAAIDILRPGVRECEVLAASWKKMTDLGSEWTQCANIVASGPYTAPYRRYTSDRIIREGDLVIIDIGGCFNGYWGDFTRTWVCGDIKPTKEQIEVHQNCYNALFNACAASVVGNTNADVFDAAYPYVLDSLGHGSGTNPWEAPFFSGSSKVSPLKLEKNMSFNLEPYAGIPGVGGARLENNLVVTDGDPDIYTICPFDERLLVDIHPLDKTTGRKRKFE